MPRVRWHDEIPPYGRDDKSVIWGIIPAATDTAYIDIITRRVREVKQVTLRVQTVATQKVFMANTFGDGYIVKKMACHPERSEGTQR